MDTATRLLFDGFPRTVASKTEDGSLMQHFVHSRGEFDRFVESMKGERDLYSSICRFRSDMRPVLDDVPFDFDSPFKETAFSEDLTDKEKIDRMRNDEEKAEEVLGDVWDDAQALARKCLSESIPAVFVFSGMGVHAHLLYQEKVSPEREKVTISNWLIDECDLETYDRQIVTDVRRVLRIPNSKRFDDGEECEIYNIPMTENEVLGNSIHDVLHRSSTLKSIEEKARYLEENRPKMEAIDGYEYSEEEDDFNVNIEVGDVDTSMAELDDWIIDNVVLMPCIAERFKSKNPKHFVRFSGAIRFFQAGFSIGETLNLIERLNWVDYDRKKSKKILTQIYKRRYSEPSCQTMQKRGFCVWGMMDDYDGDPEDCDSYGWQSGTAEW